MDTTCFYQFLEHFEMICHRYLSLFALRTFTQDSLLWNNEYVREKKLELS